MNKATNHEQVEQISMNNNYHFHPNMNKMPEKKVIMKGSMNK